MIYQINPTVLTYRRIPLRASLFHADQHNGVTCAWVSASQPASLSTWTYRWITVHTTHASAFTLSMLVSGVCFCCVVGFTAVSPIYMLHIYRTLYPYHRVPLTPSYRHRRENIYFFLTPSSQIHPRFIGTFFFFSELCIQAHRVFGSRFIRHSRMATNAAPCVGPHSFGLVDLSVIIIILSHHLYFFVVTCPCSSSLYPFFPFFLFGLGIGPTARDAAIPGRVWELAVGW